MDWVTLTGAKEVEGSLRNIVNYGPLPAASLIAKAEAFIYPRLRVREMKALVTAPLGAFSSTLPLPPGFANHLRLFDTVAGDVIEMVDDRRLATERQVDQTGTLVAGDPTFCAIFGNGYQMNMAAASARPVDIWFYQRPAALSALAPTNFLTDTYPHLLEAACLMYAADFRQDDTNYQRWSARVLQDIDTANKASLGDSIDGDLDRAFMDCVDWGRAPSRAVLKDAESYIYSVARVREMVTSLAIAVDPGSSQYLLPTEFLEPLSLIRPDGEPLTLYTPAAFDRMLPRIDDQGTLATFDPCTYAIKGRVLCLGSLPPAPAVLTLLCYARPAPLGPANPSNWLSERYSDLLRQACLAKTAMNRGDANDAMQREKRTDEMLSRINVEADLVHRSAMTPRMR